MVLLLTACYLLLTTYSFAGEGTSTGNFLKIGIGARAIALGEAFTAVSDDVTSVYWNPAGLAQLDLYEVSLMHNKWVENINYQFAGYAIPIREKVVEGFSPSKHYGVLGISAYYLSMSPIKGYYGAETPGSEGMESSQKLTAYDFATALSYGRQIVGKHSKYGSQLFAGTTLKFINKKLADKTASGAAADLSVLYLPPWSVLSGGRLRFGLNIKNIGTGLTFEKEPSPFPVDVKFGSAYTRDLFGNNFVFAVDYSRATNSVSVGAEYPLWDLIVLRAGYKISGFGKHLDSGLRAGLGLGTRHIRFDYAFTPFGLLGETHRFSLQFKFGAKPTTVDMIQEMIRKHYLRAQRFYQKDELIEAYREFKAVISFEPTHEESLKKVQEIEVAFKEFKTEVEKVKRIKELEKQIEIG
ncbi:MAG: PorV/PorQ family protein, partial [Elusimicrobiota bacterium]|nr:PorV/PorQ family protein [Elusimicrobiota bacterium]